MKRLYRGRDDVPDDDLQDVADEDENGDEDEECRSGGHAVISTIDDPSMEEEITEDVESDPVHTILLDETVDTNMHQHRKRKQEEVQDSAGEMFVASLGNSSHPKVSMDIKDHQDQDDPGSASVAHRPMVLPSAFAQRQQPRASVTSTQGSSLFSSTLSSSSSSSSPPVSVPPHPATSLLASPQTSSTFRLGHQHSVDTHRPRWTEAGRRAVEELRGISREGEDESQGQVIKDEETSQTRRAQNEGESTGMVNVQDHTVVEEGNSGGGGSGGTRNEEAEDVLWSIRDRKRPKFLHHDRSSYLRGPGRKQASTASTAGAGAGVGAGGPSVEKAPSAKASKANNEQPRLLWLRDIQQNLREERTAPPRLPSVTAYTAAIGSLNMEMDPMGGYYPSAGAVLKDMLSWLKDTPLTSPRELESRTWMLDSPVVLKPERIQ
ncbi:hypothetical protein BGZ73_001781 [Actinomortierella ambigua]|nr:hypothetical protein BGZ73_001781 [Actinomortierella ambigua]